MRCGRDALGSAFPEARAGRRAPPGFGARGGFRGQRQLRCRRACRCHWCLSPPSAPPPCHWHGDRLASWARGCGPRAAGLRGGGPDRLRRRMRRPQQRPESLRRCGDVCPVGACEGGFCSSVHVDIGCVLPTVHVWRSVRRPEQRPDHCGGCGIACASGVCEGGICSSVHLDIG